MRTAPLLIAPASSADPVFAAIEAHRTYGKRVALHRAILAHSVRSVADLAAKAPLFQDELESEAMQENAPPTLPFLAWECVLRDLSTLTNTRPAVADDPILAAIAETRRLMAARVRAANLPQPVGSIAPLPEQEAACDAFNTHVDDVLLKTVPTTAAGCAALARYAVDFLGEEGFALDEDQANEQHVRILDLIARSPMLDSVTTDRPLPPGLSGTADPVFAALDRYQAARAAWEAYCDQVQAKGDGAFGGFKVTSEEEGRLGRVWSVASTEVLETVPTTEAGRLALAAFVETWVADHGNADGSPQDGSETVFAEVYPALLNALRASVTVQG